MANPQGANRFQREKPYGAVKRLTRLQREAPMSGAPTPAANAPQRAQSQAVKGQSAEAAVPGPPPRPAPSHSAQLAAIYQELSALAPDDENLAYYAAKAHSDPT